MEHLAELMMRVDDDAAEEAVSAAHAQGLPPEHDGTLGRLARQAAHAIARATSGIGGASLPSAGDRDVRGLAETLRSGMDGGEADEALRLLRVVSDVLHEHALEIPADPRLPRSPSGFVAAFFDAVEAAFVETWRHSAEETAETCDFYTSLFEDLPVPVWRTDGHARLVYANRAWLAFTGRDERAERGEGWLESIAEDERHAFEQCLRQSSASRKPFRFEYHLRRHDGVHRWVETQAAPVRGANGEFDGFVGWTTDLTDLKRQEAQLAYMATHDPLTGLPNRRMLEEPLKRAVARAKRGTPSALLLLDLDNFKYYNDALGHVEGDQALINLALLLQTHLRAGDLLVRMGGDEFSVLLEGAGIEEARDIAERMRDAAAGEFVPRARDFGLSISLGLLMIDGAMDYRRLLGYADSAMYRAKEAGRNRVVIHTSEEQAEHIPTGSIAKRLRQAFRNDEFVLHFQPVVQLEDGAIEYFEALLRLASGDPEDVELLPPSEFLPAAQRFGLMPKITRWVLGQVLEVLRRHPDACVSMNLSAMDISDDSLASDVAQRLHESGVQPERLYFEVPEPVVTQDLPAAEERLRQLADAGCRLVLEDFGRAFTSLGMLKGLPVDLVKVDCSLAGTLDDERGHVALLAAVRTLAESQSKRVVAECVGDDTELERIRAAGYRYAQGMRLEPPAPRLDLPVHVGRA